VLVVAGDDPGDPVLVSAAATAVRRGARVVVATPYEGPIRDATAGRAAVLAPRLWVPEEFGLCRFLAVGLATLAAVDVLRSCEMDYLVMGMSAATFWNGRNGAEKYLEMMRERAGVGVSCGSFATEAALNACKVKRIAFLSPYFEVANAQVRRFYQDCGFTVVRDICLRRPSPVQIAHSTDAMCREAIRQLDGDDVEAIVQVGTNLSMIRLAAAAELFLGKPVIAINTATYWHALRAVGITDRKAGFGALMEHH
jgi:maleate isomerase